MGEKKDVWQGTLALMVLKTLDVLGALHGYGIARRIEQISGDLLTVNQGTLYPVIAAVVALGLSAVLASIVPAIQTSLISPLDALRNE